MEINDTYFTLSRNSEGFYKERGSKFLAFAFPVIDEEEIKEKLADLRKKYYNARHHCYAYVLGINGDIYRANDDGEPGHSAGDPILGQIRSNQLTNSLIVVVRYFGGTKLGVSGLINAYKTAASEAIENNLILEKFITDEITIRFEYAEMNLVMKLIKDYGLEVISQKMEISCEMTLGIRMGIKKECEGRLADMHKITIV